MLGYHSLKEEVARWKLLVAMTDFSFSAKQMSIRLKFLVLIEKSVAFSCKRHENLTFRIFLSLNEALDFHLFVVQKKPGLNSRTPKNLEELVVFGHKMKNLMKCRTDLLSQWGASIIAARSIRSKKFCPRGKGSWEKLPSVKANQHSKNVSLCITLLLLFKQFASYALKMYITADGMRNWC